MCSRASSRPTASPPTTTSPMRSESRRKSESGPLARMGARASAPTTLGESCTLGEPVSTPSRYGPRPFSVASTTARLPSTSSMGTAVESGPSPRGARPIRAVAPTLTRQARVSMHASAEEILPGGCWQDAPARTTVADDKFRSMLSDPIVALATPPGRSALAVVRLSGAGAFEVARRVVVAFRVRPARTARLATFRDRTGDTIDRGLYTVFPGPASYTGEDLVELSCHGGLLAPTRLLAAVHEAGARPAAPGEFTRRAVLNGKLDLMQAEAVGDLIDATAPAQALAALRQLDGSLSRRLADLRVGLVEAEGLLAYDIDFPGEDDGPV